MRDVKRTAAIAALALLAVPSGRAAVAQAPGPKLVVFIAVDQMRGDYLTRYASELERGFTRLATQGAWYRNAAYPYLSTVTCAGHSTLGTGTFPYHHGMILNAWFDRASGRTEACTADPSVADVSYDGTRTAGDSARHMMAPTLAELMHRTGHARVVAMSLKARSAIGLAGREADAVLWFDGRGSWASSTAYAPAPPAFLASYVEAHPMSRDAGKVWDRALQPSRYQYADDGVGEQPGNGWTSKFPHPLGGSETKLDATFLAHWEQSPYADEYLEQMAEAAVDALHMGHGPGADLLAVSFSSLDLVGHTFGPRSHEVQDMLVRLDATLDRLLKHLDAEVGIENYVLALSSDHGVADIPEQIANGGRQAARDIAKAIDDALAPFFGPGPFLAASAYTDLYFKAGIYDRLKADPKAMQAVAGALGSLPGIARVIRNEEIAAPGAVHSDDPVIRAAALSYCAGRSGDLIIIPRENWLLGGGGTTHGTLYRYDQHVPVILFGAGIKPGPHDEPATPADLAATLSSLVAVPLPSTDGHVLTGALAGTKQ